jgi:hypothetical protein
MCAAFRSGVSAAAAVGFRAGAANDGGPEGAGGRQSATGSDLAGQPGSHADGPAARHARAGRSGAGRGNNPPPLSLAGVPYQHGIGTLSINELIVDLKRQAIRFESMIGIDDAASAGQGSIRYEIWLDNSAGAARTLGAAAGGWHDRRRSLQPWPAAGEDDCDLEGARHRRLAAGQRSVAAEDLGTVNGELSVVVPAHGTILVKIGRGSRR